MTRPALHLFLLAATTLTISACKQRQHLSKDNVLAVERQFARAQAHLQSGVKDAGLTPKEVESVLGPPHRVNPPETALRDVDLFQYYYQQDKDCYELRFFNSKLIEIVHQPDTSAFISTP
jgi:hypothetical protein